MNIQEIIATFSLNYDKLESISVNKHNELSNVDKELVNFYHNIEGIHLSHNTQGHNLILELQDILKRRRELKKETILIRSFLDTTAPSMESAKKRNKEAIKKHFEIVNNIEKSKKINK